jgi:hypothetical protein
MSESMGGIISECPGDFVGIRIQGVQIFEKVRKIGPKVAHFVQSVVVDGSANQVIFTCFKIVALKELVEPSNAGQHQQKFTPLSWSQLVRDLLESIEIGHGRKTPSNRRDERVVWFTMLLSVGRKRYIDRTPHEIQGGK